MKNMIKISVRNLVEFVMSSGDLDRVRMNNARAVDGTRIHKLIQSSSGDNYDSEVMLKYVYEGEELEIEVSGRADGIIREGDRYTIDEIKSTTKPLKEITEDMNPLHWAQAKGYGFIFALKNEIETIDIQLTYYQLEEDKIIRFKKSFCIQELKNDFIGLIEEYLGWAEKIDRWIKLRDQTIEQLQFPYGEFRKGQRKLAVSVYTALKEKEKLFLKAPTGIGKTLGTAFPTLKYMGEEGLEKIFYLTAKTITRTAAEDAFHKMRCGGLRLKTLTITAKDKICIDNTKKCDPEECEYAKGFFDKLKPAIKDIFENEDSFDRNTILEYSEKHKLCPFEYSLSLAECSDVIICDYNYAYDPRVFLRRFFGESKKNYAVLVDEAHNLVDRAREMYSAEIYKQPILDIRKKIEDDFPNVVKTLNKINRFMIEARKECEESDGVVLKKEAPDMLYPYLTRFIEQSEEILENGANKEYFDEFMEFYFKAVGMVRTWEFYDGNYVTYYEKMGQDIKIKLFCLDPSKVLQDKMKMVRSTILFSATLIPLDYYMKLLGGNDESLRLSLESSFEQKNLCLLVNDKISTKYREREKTILQLCNEIMNVVLSKKGNYMIFFPSYKYMNDALEILNMAGFNHKIDLIVQDVSMNEREREEFLQEFDKERESSMAAFTVMGGIFGEGIDLTGDRLTGAIIVGVGLPQICFERDIIKQHFNDKGKNGFNYSYVYPGMNRVLQAAGRVIRTEEDRGVVLLIDERFSYGAYKGLFPEEWSHYHRIADKDDLEDELSVFWS